MAQRRRPRATVVTCRDERGEFLSVTDHRGAIFLLDLEDEGALDVCTWTVYELCAGPARRKYKYAFGRPGGKLKGIHRFIMNDPQNMLVDHADGNTLNDRKYNLRVCSDLQNTANRKFHNKPNPLGYRGVYMWPDGSIYSMISLKDVKTYLGKFATLQDAARAWDARAYAERGEFAVLNFPQEYGL